VSLLNPSAWVEAGSAQMPSGIYPADGCSTRVATARVVDRLAQGQPPGFGRESGAYRNRCGAGGPGLIWRNEARFEHEEAGKRSAPRHVVHVPATTWSTKGLLALEVELGVRLSFFAAGSATKCPERPYLNISRVDPGW